MTIAKNQILELILFLKQSDDSNFHLFMYSRKRSLRDCVIKLRDNRIFKALL